MKPREVFQTIRLRSRPRDRRARILASCHDVGDVRRQAQRALPRSVFDYVEGGADEETTTRRNVAAFRSWQFQPRPLVDVSIVDPTTTLLGVTLPMPMVLAPTGYTRMMHPDGEVAVARAAASRQLPYTLSTVATTSVEDVAAAMTQVSASSQLWMQLYLFRDREQSWRLLERAWKNGVRVLEFSVDTAVAGFRVRDQRNGFTIPPSLSPATVLDMGMHPRYWVSMVQAPALTFANFTSDDGESTIAGITSQFDSALSWQDIRAVRERWRGSLAIKGPVPPDVARRARDEGVDLLHLSNHGGRQLDRCVPPVETITGVRAAVGDLPIVVDSGVRHGMDIAIAVALGADAVAIGRPYLYGLAAAGEEGVAHVIDLLAAQFARTMQLLGVTSVAELRDAGPSLIERVRT